MPSGTVSPTTCLMRTCQEAKNPKEPVSRIAADPCRSPYAFAGVYPSLPCLDPLRARRANRSNAATPAKTRAFQSQSEPRESSPSSASLPLFRGRRFHASRFPRSTLPPHAPDFVGLRANGGTLVSNEGNSNGRRSGLSPEGITKSFRYGSEQRRVGVPRGQ